ncbi:MAG: hypothetical protein V1853_00200 [bacterium]
MNPPQSSSVENQTKEWMDRASLDPSLPECPADTSSLFTKPFMDGDLPDYIVPLGNSNDQGHVVPVDHIYPIINDLSDNIPVYAPSDMTLIWIEVKQKYSNATNKFVGNDYQVNLSPCRGINLSMVHYKELSDKLKAAVHEQNMPCDTVKTVEDDLTWYYTCHPTFDKVTLQAGQVIGFMGTLGGKDYVVDYGLHDYNKPALAFINPDRHYTFTLHTACMMDYYTPELRVKYLTKFGGFKSKGSDVQVFVQRTTEPVCGNIMQDVSGTAAGDWFKNPITQKNVTDNDALILIHDNVEPAYAKISMGGITSFTFIPGHSGRTDREFSEVTADGNTYCYEYNRGEDWKKVLLQLVDDTHIKTEHQTGRCGADEVFISPLIYER